MKRKYPPVDVLAAAYARTKSIWKVAKELGLVGQVVHKHLTRGGISCSRKMATPEQEHAIVKYYNETPAETFHSAELAKDLGLPRSMVSEIAAKHGLAKSGRKPNAVTKQKMPEITKNTWARLPHPKGMLGKKHTPETLKLVTEASRRSWATQKLTKTGNASPEAMERNKRHLAEVRETMVKKPYTRTNGGCRPDLGDTYWRSSWEANYARYLNLLKKMKIIEEWRYESETFWFDGVKRGTNSYKPDFFVKFKHDPIPERHEIKGWVTAKDRTKWRRMKKYYPEIKLIIIGQKEYENIKNKWRGAIPEWESPKRKPSNKIRLGMFRPWKN